MSLLTRNRFACLSNTPFEVSVLARTRFGEFSFSEGHGFSHAIHCALGGAALAAAAMFPIRRVHNFGTYFVTANCAEKRRVFQVDASAALLFDVLQDYREHYKLHAFVIMPDHFHILLTPGPEKTLERCMQLVKGGFSRRYHLAGGVREVWQKGYADHRCRDRADFLVHKNYIEQNPVKAGLCGAAEEYRWSSASRELRAGHSLSG